MMFPGSFVPMETGILSRRKSIVILIITGLIGFALFVFRTLAHSEVETIQVDLPLSAIIQTGLLIMSALLLFIGSYMTGYRRGSRTGSRLTLDFSKKTGLQGKGQ